MEPLSGPLEGGTALTVDGENLGLSANDTSVSVAGLSCDSVEYLSAVRYHYTIELYISFLLTYLTVSQRKAHSICRY